MMICKKFVKFRPQLRQLDLAQKKHRFQRGQDAGDMQSARVRVIRVIRVTAETHHPQVDAGRCRR